MVNSDGDADGDDGHLCFHGPSVAFSFGPVRIFSIDDEDIRHQHGGITSDEPSMNRR